MNKKVPLIAIPVGIIIVIIILSMNIHPSLAEIVENRDCQEIGKWDQRMDEIYGYDVKKAKAELNISDELFSEARKLGISCALGGAKEVLGGESDEESRTPDEIVVNLFREIVANEDLTEACDALDELYYKYDFRYLDDDLNQEIFYLVVECEDAGKWSG